MSKSQGNSKMSRAQREAAAVRETEEHKALVLALRRGLPETKWRPLAEAAGLQGNELGELKSAIARGRRFQAPAREWPEVSRQWRELNAQRQKVAAALDAAQSDAERRPLAQQYRALEAQRAGLRSRWAQTKIAAEGLAALRLEGLAD